MELGGATRDTTGCGIMQEGLISCWRKEKVLLPVLYVRKRLPSFLFVKELRSLSQEVGNKGVIKSFFPSSFPFQWKDRFDAEHG